MPDQSSAAEEYAILQEITVPTTRLPDDPVRVAADVDFPVALRGYDRVAVDAYVKRMSQLVAELEATRSPEAAVHRALERVGEQISGVLQRARETAEQMTTQSRREAEDRLELARQEAAQVVAAAAQRIRHLDAEAERISAERLRLVDDAREFAGQLIALADAATERFPPDEPEVTAQADTAEEALELEAAQPQLAAESQAVAELWAAAAGRTPEHDPTAVLPRAEPARNAQPPAEEHPGTR
ncbi:MAG: DivIVA domain-containing protein [Solirubrobacteraceae bacterium]